MVISEIGPEHKVCIHQAYPKASQRNKACGYAWEFRSTDMRFPWRKPKKWKRSLRDHRS